MSVALRPMSLGEILDRTFQIYRGRFWVFLGIALSPLIARLATLLLLGPLLSRVLEQTTFTHSTKLAVRHLFARLPLNILWGYLECMAWVVIAAVAAELFAGKSTTLRSGFEICGARWKSWLGFSILLCFLVFLIPSFLQRLLLVRVLHSDGIYDVFGSGSPLTRLLLLAVVSAGGGVPQCVLLALVALSAPAWNIERLAAFTALRRGFELGRSTWGRTSVAWIMCAVLQWMTRAMTSALMAAVLYGLGSLVHIGESRMAFTAIAQVPSQVAALLVGPLFPIALTLLYYDQRIRKEGFDIEWMMQSAGMGPETVAAGESAAGEIASVPVEGAEA